MSQNEKTEQLKVIQSHVNGLGLNTPPAMVSRGKNSKNDITIISVSSLSVMSMPTEVLQILQALSAYNTRPKSARYAWLGATTGSLLNIACVVEQLSVDVGDDELTVRATISIAPTPEGNLLRFYIDNDAINMTLLMSKKPARHLTGGAWTEYTVHGIGFYAS